MRLPILSLFSLLALAPGARALEPRLEQLVPDDAAIFFAVHDVPAQRTDFAASAFGRAWADPGIARFFAPLAEEPRLAEVSGKIKAETGYTPSELLDFAAGDILVFVPAGKLRFDANDEGAEVLVLLEVGENEGKLRELMAAQAKKNARPGDLDPTEDYNGVTLHIRPEPPAAPEVPATADPASPAPAGTSAKKHRPLVWALHAGRWILSTDRELVTGALDALAAGGLTPSLASSPDYLSALDRAGGKADYLLGADFKRVYPALAAAVESNQKANPKPNPLGVEPSTLLAALGLDVIDGFYLSATTDGGVARADALLAFHEARGLMGLLAYRDGPVARPDWVPAEWFNVSSQNFSLPEAYVALETMLERASPMLSGLVQGQLKGMERKLGVELKRDLVGSLGTSFVSGYALPSGSDAEKPPAYDELDQFVAVALADAATFERALEAVKAATLPPGDASPLQKRDYLGHALYSLQGGEGARGVSYAIADGWLLVSVGGPGPVESVLQRLRTPEPEGSFWRRADVRAALEPVPADAFSVQHTDLTVLLASVAASLVKVQAAQGEGGSKFLEVSAQPTRAELAKFFKYTVSHGRRVPAGFQFHSEGPAN